MHLYMTSNDVKVHLAHGSEADRLDRIHNGLIYENPSFNGLAVHLNLDGSYSLWAFEKDSPTDSYVILTMPGRETLSDDGLVELHQLLAPLAKEYGAAESAAERQRIMEAAAYDIPDRKFDKVGDFSYFLSAGEDAESMPAAISSGLSEPEVIDWVYTNAFPLSGGYANRETLAEFMLDYYPEIERIRYETADD